jgi:hypothetical protein
MQQRSDLAAEADGWFRFRAEGEAEDQKRKEQNGEASEHCRN